MKKKKIIIVGAGPGGLACGMILASKGFDVHIYEKEDKVGGRNGFIQAGDYKFDIGPTFFLMKDVLEKIFNLCGRDLHKYAKLVDLDPMYKLVFKDKVFHPSTNEEKMIEELNRVFPGNAENYKRYMAKEKVKYEKLIPCLEIPYGKYTDYLSMNLVKAAPYLDATKSIYEVLGKYFDDEILKLCFTFQAKYIGMSPWKAPGLFSMISYIEHGGGVYHVMGGLNQLSLSMAKVLEEFGGKIYLNKTVKEVLTKDGKATGIKLENGEIINADDTVLNADFAYAMKNLIPEDKRKKYKDKKLESMKYSCSTFMLYLGLDKVYTNINHHNIFFSHDYKKNVDEITENQVVSDDPSFYVHNPSRIDKSLAPEGKSAVYVLVPIGNKSKGISWEERKAKYKEKIIDLLESKAGMENIREHIEEIRVITPDDWQNNMNIFQGATFNLAHNMGQMLYKRPHNEFEEFKNCYLVGGGTHPGSGLPTIYESGRISAKLIMDKYGVKFDS
jgi:phytoene desaturase